MKEWCSLLAKDQDDTGSGAFLLLFNEEGFLALQRRSANKDLFPEKWTVSASGHIKQGETAREAIIRETREEIGIELDAPKYIGAFSRTKPSLFFDPIHPAGTAHVFLAHISNDSSFEIDPEEVQEIQWFKVYEISALHDKTPSVDQCLAFMVEQLRRREMLEE